MIGTTSAAAAVARLAPLLGKSFDEIAQAELARRLAGLDLDIDLDAVVTGVILDGSKYEAALRNFMGRIDDARRNAVRAEQPAQRERDDVDPAIETRTDDALLRSLAEQAAWCRQIRRPDLAAACQRRSEWIKAGRPAGSPHAWRVGREGAEEGREPSAT